ncbi:MAG: flagellar protein FlgN [Gammaproteobacteria bacterium]|nr:flagellar protein FlgN [Gammaproteobacteria bacterium]
MHNHAAQIQDENLYRILGKEYDTSRQLLSCLEKVSVALKSGDMEPLSDLIQAENRLSQQLEHLSDKHRRLISKEGYAFSNKGMNDYLRDKQAPTAVKEEWRTTVELLAKCEHENQQNALHTHQQKNLIEDALRVLQDNSDAPHIIYNAQGKSQLNEWRKRTLGNA